MNDGFKRIPQSFFIPFLRSLNLAPEEKQSMTKSVE